MGGAAKQVSGSVVIYLENTPCDDVTVWPATIAHSSNRRGVTSLA